MSPLPLIPAAPASSGPNLRDVPSGTSAPTTGRDGAGSSFEDVLTRSAADEKSRDPSEKEEEAVEDSGIVCVSQAQQPLVILQPAEPDLQFASAGLDSGVMEAAALESALAENSEGEPAAVLIQGGLNPSVQPTLEQPLSISRPLAQAAFQTSAAFTAQPSPISLSAAVASVGQGAEGFQPQDVVAADTVELLPVLGDLEVSEGGMMQAEVLSSEANHSSLDPAKNAGSVSLADSKPAGEQITFTESTPSGERAAESAAISAFKPGQALSPLGDSKRLAPKQLISAGPRPTGTDGADVTPAMSAALLQPSRTANSQKDLRESLSVFGGAMLEEPVGPGEFSGPVAVPDLATGYSSPVSDVPVHSQSVQLPAVAPQSPQAQADSARALEHLEMTLAKYRPNVPPHLEIQVDLQGGDILQVRLDLRGDALQSTFRTDSSELRMALQRAWPEFVERSQQNGLNLAPASFDSPGMSSDSGAGSQADGRRQGSQESEGPLPEAFRKTPNQFARKGGEPSQRTSEPARTRWA
jgi:hypothetical protein